MRRGVIVAGLLGCACFSDPPEAADDGTKGTESGGSAPTSAADSSTAITEDFSSSRASSGASSGATFSGSGATSDSSITGGTCVEGELDCPCFPNETCEAPWVCRGDVCVPGRCSNGTLDPGEDCDDGNNLPGDGCSADCVYETQCFVGNFGGEGTIELASFAIDRAGDIRYRATETTVGTSFPPQSIADETSLSGLGRFVYLVNGETVESFEIGLDGTFATTGIDLDIPGLLGLATDRRLPWALAVADDGILALHRVESEPSGANPEIGQTTTVLLDDDSDQAREVLIDFHPQLDIAYVAVEPGNFLDPVELITLEFEADGELGTTQAEVLPNNGYIRGMRAVEQPAELLLTGIFYSNDGDACFGRIELQGNGQLAGAAPTADCLPPWGGYAGILQPNPGVVIFGTTAARIAEWDGEGVPVNTVQTMGVRHFLRQPWPDMLLVASDRELLTVGLDAGGATTRPLDQLDLDSVGLASEDGGNAAFQAGVMIPCPVAR